MPLARWFWAGSGRSATCPMNITFEDNIDIHCLNQKIYLFVGADNRFNATFLGKTLSGSNHKIIFNTSIDPRGFACSNLLVTKMVLISFGFMLKMHQRQDLPTVSITLPEWFMEWCKNNQMPDAASMMSITMIGRLAIAYCVLMWLKIVIGVQD